MNVCYIVGAGEFTPRGFAPMEGDLVIAADGGYRALSKHGFKPDLLMGDLDSLGDAPLPPGLPVERFPVKKNDTDTGLALERGAEMGYRAFALYGCAGGRTDHLLANLQALCHYSRKGMRMQLAAPDYDAYAVTNGTLTLPLRPEGAYVSVFCDGERAEGVTLRGLTYPLTDHTLVRGEPLGQGVSNQIERSDTAAQISVQNGTLLVIVAAGA